MCRSNTIHRLWWISAIDRYNRWRITDFGIAKRTASATMTQTGRAMGTPHYMSPEQLSSDLPLDGRCDLWALGAVLYQMASGVRPFSNRLHAV